jgi:16S rRNA (uracil1498-N3)-methyltransferase
VALTLAQAVLKGDKMDDVVRDAVMLGFAVVQPIVTARSEVSLSALTRGDRHERWQRIAVSSAKQCGRAVVPVVAPPIAFEGRRRWRTCRHRSSCSSSPARRWRRRSRSRAGCRAASGRHAGRRTRRGLDGDGGGAVRAPCAPVDLGSLTLRADAAAVVAAHALLTQWKLI